MARGRRGDNSVSEDKLENSQYPEFGREIRSLLRYGKADQISNREAGARTKINYVTISTMANGSRPEIETILKFALKMEGASLNRLLRLANYEPIDLTPEQLRHHGLVPTNLKIVPADEASEEKEMSMAKARLEAAIDDEVREHFRESPEYKEALRDHIYMQLANWVKLAAASARQK